MHLTEVVRSHPSWRLERPYNYKRLVDDKWVSQRPEIMRYIKDYCRSKINNSFITKVRAIRDYTDLESTLVRIVAYSMTLDLDLQYANAYKDEILMYVREALYDHGHV